MANIENKLARLRLAFIQGLPARWQLVQAAWAEARAGGSGSASTLHRELHSLIGASGTFGFHDLSRALRESEQKLKPYREDDLPVSLIEEIEQDMNNLDQQVAGICRDAPDAPTKPATPPSSQDAADEPKPEAPLIYWLAGEPADCRETARALADYGYRLRLFDCPGGFHAAVSEKSPRLVLLDREASALDSHRIEREIRTLEKSGIPAILLSSHEGLQSRLEAVRAGASGYLLKPLDLARLTKLVRDTTGWPPERPGRVLLVEDQASVARFYQTLLQSGGMEVLVETRAERTLDRLSRFKPDLIILDIYMPHIAGTELAAMLRQFEEYQLIPIIFLSADTSFRRKTDLLELGATDLLPKDLEPQDFLAHIRYRLSRARLINGLATSDSLTGLLNHAETLHRLQAELTRASRQKQPVSVIFLDIDHFKAINDTHGHAIGDKMLRALAGLLRGRLRLSDIIGRYGGEEFLVMLPGTEAEAAQKVAEDLRLAFSHQTLITSEGKVSATLSAGVADSRLAGDVDSLINAADEAMYAAKAGGRNRVMVAGAG